MTFAFESTKAIIATVMWFWLVLDSIFYKPRYYYDSPGKRIAVALVSVILVIVLFYPTVVYASYARTEVVPESQLTAEHDEENGPAVNETSPLLAERT